MKVILPDGNVVYLWEPGDLIGGTGVEPFDPRGVPGIRIEPDNDYENDQQPDDQVPPIVQSSKDSSPFTLTAIGALLNEPDDTQNWVVEGIIPAGGVGVVASKPKVGKSTMTRDLAVEVSRPLGGGKWLGRSCASGPVWYLAFEGRRRDIKEHFRQLGATADHALHVFIGQAPGNVVTAVRKLADEQRPALIIIDTMQRFLRAKSNDDYAEMTTLLDAVIGIARSSGAAVLLLHHAGKADRASIDAAQPRSPARRIASFCSPDTPATAPSPRHNAWERTLRKRCCCLMKPQAAYALGVLDMMPTARRSRLRSARRSRMDR